MHHRPTLARTFSSLASIAPVTLALLLACGTDPHDAQDLGSSPDEIDAATNELDSSEPDVTSDTAQPEPDATSDTAQPEPDVTPDGDTSDFDACPGGCCDEGTLSCAGACARCDDPNAEAFGCAGDRCVPAACARGFLVCGGRCAECPDRGTAFGCDGDQCVVSECAGSDLFCDGVCADCPRPDLGSPVCVGTQCELVCDVGAHRCGEACRRDDDVSACGEECVQCPPHADGTAICEAGVCGVRCNAGFHACDGACVANDAVATCGDRCTPCPGGTNGACVDEQCTLVSCPPGAVRCETGCCNPTLAIPPIAPGHRLRQDSSTEAIAMARDASGRLVLVTVSEDLIFVRRARARSFEDAIVRPAAALERERVVLLMTPDDTALVFAVSARQLTLFRVAVDGTWTSEAIGPVADLAGATHGAALASDGTIHVVRLQTVGGVSELRHSRKAPGGAWTHELIPAAAQSSVDIALDASGSPHVVWANADNKGFSHATTNGAWSSEVVGAHPANNTRLAIDSVGNVQVLYASRIGSAATTCRWARKSAAGWAEEHVSPCRSARSIALLGTTPHVALVDSEGDALILGVRNGASWSTDFAMFTSWSQVYDADLELDAQGRPVPALLSSQLDLLSSSSIATLDVFFSGAPWIADLAIGPDGSLHIVYGTLADDASVVYLHLDGRRERRWVLGESIVRDVGLALDARGYPMVAWRNLDGVSARRFDGQDWTETSSLSSDEHGTVALVADHLGRGHVVFDLDSTLFSGGSLGYSVLGLDGKLGPVATVEPVPDTSHADIALGAGGEPIVVYRKYGDVPSLRYAARAPNGTWTLEDADDGRDLGNAVGANAVLLVAADGTPHVIYRDENAGDVKHARRVGGQWTRSYIATEGRAGETIAGAFAPDGTLHVVIGADVGASHATWSGGAWTLAASVLPPAGSMGSMVIDADGRTIIPFRSGGFTLLDL